MAELRLSPEQYRRVVKLWQLHHRDRDFNRIFLSVEDLLTGVTSRVWRPERRRWRLHGLGFDDLVSRAHEILLRFADEWDGHGAFDDRLVEAVVSGFDELRRERGPGLRR